MTDTTKNNRWEDAMLKQIARYRARHPKAFAEADKKVKKIKGRDKQESRRDQLADILMKTPKEGKRRKK